MRAVAAVDGVERVRLSSVEVIHLRDALIDALAEEPRICPHLHVPLQSGDDGVLRGDGPQLRLGRLTCGGSSACARACRTVNVTTDVIVGFPAEDEAAFERTLDTVRAAGITRVHTFTFSPRPGTEADAQGDPVPPEEKKRRSREMRGLSEALGRHAPRASAWAPRRKCWSTRRADDTGLRLQPRLHALLPAGGRGAAGRDGRRPGARAARRRHPRRCGLSADVPLSE